MGSSQSGRAPADGPIRIVLVRDLACLAALGLSDPGADWVAGLAVLGERTIALRVERSGASIPAVAAVLRHELAHVALHVASAGRAPRWLQEGYAQLESGTFASSRVPTVNDRFEIPASAALPRAISIIFSDTSIA